MKKQGWQKKFKLNPKYVHKRSEGITWRRNGGSYLQFVKTRGRHCKTALGMRLIQIRDRIVKDGVPLLGWDEIEKEVEAHA